MLQNLFDDPPPNDANESVTNTSESETTTSPNDGTAEQKPPEIPNFDISNNNGTN